MNRKELIDLLSEKTNTSKKAADDFLRAFTEAVVDELKKGGTVSLVGFGTFKVVQRKERKGKNPQTGAEMIIPARRSPVFKFSKNLKEV
ncbi:MAG: HU family DNA-binding protein [Calditrichia bacterium]